MNGIIPAASFEGRMDHIRQQFANRLPKEGCTQDHKYNRALLYKHLESECPWYTVQCQECEGDMQRFEIKNHTDK
jgi:hypothetical protein